MATTQTLVTVMFGGPKPPVITTIPQAAVKNIATRLDKALQDGNRGSVLSGPSRERFENLVLTD